MLIKVCLTKIRISYFLFIALLITAAASARQNAAQMPPQAQQNSTPTQAHSSKMYLDVVVSQKSGPPVAGLQQQDFTLLDNKSPQTITSFKEIAGRQAPINVVLVIDAVNVDARTIAYEREQIGKFLSSEGGQLAYPTVLSVFTETGIQISGEFTNDGNALRSELDSDKIGLRAVGRAAGFYGATERLQLSAPSPSSIHRKRGRAPGSQRHDLDFSRLAYPLWPQRRARFKTEAANLRGYCGYVESIGPSARHALRGESPGRIRVSVSGLLL